MLENINEISILVAAILAAAVGSIWYSPLLFGTVWMKSIGLTLEEGELPKKQMMIATLKGVVLHALFFYVIGEYVKVSIQNNVSLAYLAASLLILISAHTAQGVLWEKRPVAYVLIQGGYMALVLFGGVAVIAFWPW